MAEENSESEGTEQSVAGALSEGGEAEGSKASGKLSRILLPAGVVAVAAVAGCVVSLMLGSGSAPRQAVAEAEREPPPPAPQQKFEHYDLEPIVVNLNEPRLTRYIRAKLKLAIGVEDYKAAAETIDKRKGEVKSWLILYLADCSLDQVRGARNLNRILGDIKDMLNQRLWPEGRPLIIKVDYDDWVIQ